MSDWFNRWFGKEYLELYPHRDDAEARAAVSMIRRVLREQLPAPTAILDVACGTGRHSRALSEWGWTVGFDLSMTLLQVAKGDSPNAPYVRGDMRMLPFAPETFSLVVNLFTSFGYFDTDAQHVAVMQEIARVTRPGGVFVIDYLNAEEVRRTLVPFDERIVDGRRVSQRRTISPDGRYVQKTITAEQCDQTYEERVRLFAPEELRHMVEEQGFRVQQTLGDYDGSVWTPDAPRVILMAERQ